MAQLNDLIVNGYTRFLNSAYGNLNGSATSALCAANATNASTAATATKALDSDKLGGTAAANFALTGGTYTAANGLSARSAVSAGSATYATSAGAAPVASHDHAYKLSGNGTALNVSAGINLKPNGNIAISTAANTINISAKDTTYTTLNSINTAQYAALTSVSGVTGYFNNGSAKSADKATSATNAATASYATSAGAAPLVSHDHAYKLSGNGTAVNVSAGVNFKPSGSNIQYFVSGNDIYISAKNNTYNTGNFITANKTAGVSSNGTSIGTVNLSAIAFSAGSNVALGTAANNVITITAKDTTYTTLNSINSTEYNALTSTSANNRNPNAHQLSSHTNFSTYFNGTSANTALTAKTANSAATATKDSSGNVIVDTYGKKVNDVFYVVGSYNTTTYPTYNNTQTYAKSAYAVYNGRIYSATAAVPTATGWPAVSSKFSTANITVPLLGNTTATADASALTAGLKISYFMPLQGGSTTQLNLNGLGAKTIRVNNSNMTTHYPSGTIVNLTYDGTYWKCADWADGNTNTYVTQNSSTENLELPIILKRTTGGNETQTVKYSSGFIYNPSTSSVKIGSGNSLLTNTANLILGIDNTAAGYINATIGTRNYVSSINGLLVGQQSTAIGPNAIVMGPGNAAITPDDAAFSNNIAIGYGCSSIGYIGTNISLGFCNYANSKDNQWGNLVIGSDNSALQMCYSFAGGYSSRVETYKGTAPETQDNICESEIRPTFAFGYNVSSKGGAVVFGHNNFGMGENSGYIGKAYTDTVAGSSIGSIVNTNMTGGLRWYDATPSGGEGGPFVVGSYNKGYSPGTFVAGISSYGISPASFVACKGNVAIGYAQTVFGKYNYPENSIITIGAGTADDYRKNIFAISGDYANANFYIGRGSDETSSHWVTNYPKIYVGEYIQLNGGLSASKSISSNGNISIGSGVFSSFKNNTVADSLVFIASGKDVSNVPWTNAFYANCTGFTYSSTNTNYGPSSMGWKDLIESFSGTSAKTALYAASAGTSVVRACAGGIGEYYRGTSVNLGASIGATGSGAFDVFLIGASNTTAYLNIANSLEPSDFLYKTYNVYALQSGTKTINLSGNTNSYTFVRPTNVSSTVPANTTISIVLNGTEGQAGYTWSTTSRHLKFMYARYNGAYFLCAYW